MGLEETSEAESHASHASHVQAEGGRSHRHGFLSDKGLGLIEMFKMFIQFCFRERNPGW